jgi:hypothetical protein
VVAFHIADVRNRSGVDGFGHWFGFAIIAEGSGFALFH